jgi:hypothetical protein
VVRTPPVTAKQTKKKNKRKNRQIRQQEWRAKQQAAGEPISRQHSMTAAAKVKPPASSKTVPSNAMHSGSPLATPRKPSSSSKPGKKGKNPSAANTMLSQMSTGALSSYSEQLMLPCYDGLSDSDADIAPSTAPLHEFEGASTAVQQKGASRGSVWDRLEGGREMWLHLA